MSGFLGQEGAQDKAAETSIVLNLSWARSSSSQPVLPSLPFHCLHHVHAMKSCSTGQWRTLLTIPPVAGPCAEALHHAPWSQSATNLLHGMFVIPRVGSTCVPAGIKLKGLGP